MTTFRYTVEFDDSERITLGAALDLLKEECEMNIAKQPGAPYLASLRSIVTIKSKLETGGQQVSGSAVVQTGEENLELRPRFIDDIMLSIEEAKAGQVKAYKFGESAP